LKVSRRLYSLAFGVALAFASMPARALVSDGNRLEPQPAACHAPRADVRLARAPEAAAHPVTLGPALVPSQATARPTPRGSRRVLVGPLSLIADGGLCTRGARGPPAPAQRSDHT
jgi:hypothetical protein